MLNGKRLCVASIVAIVSACGMASAQTPAVGPRANQFPDVIVSGVGSSASDILYYGTTGGISAYALGSVSCNIGTDVAIWIDNSTNQYGAQHPVIGGQVYRLFDGRFEQVGTSWLKHGFCAADAPNCVSLANPGTPNPTYVNNGSCDWLGLYATDTYSAGLNGGQSYLGPRSEVNAWTGVFPYPYVLGAGGGHNCISKRLQIPKADLDITTLYPGAQYFGEVVYVCTDEWERQRNNNYSWRRLNIGNLQTAASSGASNTCTGEQGRTMSFNGATVPKQAAIEAWKLADPTVRISYVEVPNDGQVAVASKVTDRGNGTWRYEYAVMNLNSHRSVNSFSISKSASATVSITNVAQVIPRAHSGEVYSTTSWINSTAGDSVAWTTDAFSSNPNASAIRWSMLYNFRFISNMPPTAGMASLGLFRPAIQPGDDDRLDVPGLDVPSVPTNTCRQDFDNSGTLTVNDIFDFLNAWFVGDIRADFDSNASLGVSDIFDFLAAWFAGC
jgi:hypothetical protein